MPLITLPVIV
jgi:hypothetical protein